MGAMTVEHGGWYPVTDAGSVGVVRRAAAHLAAELELTEARLGELAIVSAELAGNLYKYAVDGVVHLRRLRCGEDRGVELVAIDAGPGMADLAVSVADGHSTSGTLGIGLGAIRRQATRVDAYSRPGRGTVLAASVWSAPPPASWAEGLVRPIAGETASGDGYAVRSDPDHRQVMLCDGLGHGLAAQRATVEFGAAPPGGPRLVLEHLHRALARTRGAVAAVVDLAGDTLRFAGLGNISAWVTDGTTRRAMTSLPGIVGHQRPEIREFEYRLPPGAVVVLHTDGLTDRWELTPYPGLLDRQPVLVAATLMRDAGRRRDDAGVLVAKAPR